MEYTIRPIELKDLDRYEYWLQPERKHHDFNGPYFGRRDEEQLREYIETLRETLEKGEDPLPQKRLVLDESGVLIGQVNWYWKSEETYWMEIGIVIFNDEYWGKGLGYVFMSKWIDLIFDEYPQLIRLGLTTWSGNDSMMRLAEKLGFVKEAVYRKARIVNGLYYDSVSYGILKEEWEAKDATD